MSEDAHFSQTNEKLQYLVQANVDRAAAAAGPLNNTSAIGLIDAAIDRLGQLNDLAFLVAIKRSELLPILATSYVLTRLFTTKRFT